MKDNNFSDNSKKLSYSAANTFPVKLLQYKGVPDIHGKIPPVHIQLNPTNICNLNCDFCSCSKRDKSIEWDFDEAVKTMTHASLLGCRVVTITGGGEPLLYSKINELILLLHDDLNIQIGLVTNGTQFSKIRMETLEKITWCRISHSDNRSFGSQYKAELSLQVALASSVDWSFSYVLSNNPNYNRICDIVKYANRKGFTHVRIVSDLLDTENIPSMELVKAMLKNRVISDNLVIYQGRKEFTSGRKKCLISLLKPIIGADRKLYPCCGSQYSMDPPSGDYDSSMCMGLATEMYNIYQEQKHFDGSQCVRCYYDNYNSLLEQMIIPLEHKEFV